MRRIYHYEPLERFRGREIHILLMSDDFLQWVTAVEDESFADMKLDFLFVNERGAFFREREDS